MTLPSQVSSAHPANQPRVSQSPVLSDNFLAKATEGHWRWSRMRVRGPTREEGIAGCCWHGVWLQLTAPCATEPQVHGQQEDNGLHIMASAVRGAREACRLLRAQRGHCTVAKADGGGRGGIEGAAAQGPFGSCCHKSERASTAAIIRRSRRIWTKTSSQASRTKTEAACVEPSQTAWHGGETRGANSSRAGPTAQCAWRGCCQTERSCPGAPCTFYFWAVLLAAVRCDWLVSRRFLL